MAYKNRNYKQKDGKILCSQKLTKKWESKHYHSIGNEKLYGKLNELSSCMRKERQKNTLKEYNAIKISPQKSSDIQMLADELQERQDNFFFNSNKFVYENTDDEKNNVKRSLKEESKEEVLESIDKKEVLEDDISKDFILNTAWKTVGRYYIKDEKELPPESIKEFKKKRRIPIKENRLIFKGGSSVLLHLDESLFDKDFVNEFTNVITGGKTVEREIVPTLAHGSADVNPCNIKFEADSESCFTRSMKNSHTQQYASSFYNNVRTRIINDYHFFEEDVCSGAVDCNVEEDLSLSYF